MKPIVAAAGASHEHRLDRAELLRRADALAPVLRERATLADKLRRAPDETVDDLRRSKLLRICQPARFGGSEEGWDTLCECLVTLGRGDGSQAWVASVYAAMAWQTALFGDEAQQDVWGDDVETIIAGSLIPVGNRVTMVDGGYRLSGRWPFTSGAHHAGWLILGELVEVGTKPEHGYFLVPSRDCQIDDDWFAVGMAGTGSTTMVLDDVFVPAHRILFNRDVTVGKPPGALLNTSHVFRMPLFGFAQLVLAAVAVGVAAGMVEDFKAHIRARSSGPSPISGIDLIHARLSEVAVESRAATLLLLDAARAAMARLNEGQALNEEDAVVTLRDSAYALRIAKQAATKIFESSGGHGLDLGTPIQRGFRDVHAAGNHGSLSWERVALRYAQVALRA